jgi:hypothetical protein
MALQFGRSSSGTQSKNYIPRAPRLSLRHPSVKYVIIFPLLIIGPVLVSAAEYVISERRWSWQTADRSSAGLLPAASEHPDALIRVYAARTVRWRGIFAVHSWIIVKERGAPHYTRYDYTAWGEPIRVDGFAADGRWFGALPETIVGVDGEDAERLIPKIRSVIESYRFRAYGDYPGPVQTPTPLCKLLWMQFQSSMQCCRPLQLERTIHTMANGTVSRPRELEFSLTSPAISD